MLEKLQDCKELMQEGESSSNSAINALDIVMVSPEKEWAEWLTDTLLIYKNYWTLLHSYILTVILIY